MATVHNIDLVKLRKLISLQIDNVTCLECCKYYRAPTTAACKHTLCHTCWYGRRTCPVCTTSLDCKNLKLNLQLQSLTEHIQTLAEAVEKVFNMKFDEFNLDSPDKIEPEKDPIKDVRHWLTSSQNHFSVQSTQISSNTPEVAYPMEISSSNIQIHTNTKKLISPSKVMHIPPPQDDWDKIEPIPDPNDNYRNKENVVGPMDIEASTADDIEYTSDKPRRSSRKKEVKIDDCTLKSRDIATKCNSRELSENKKKLEKSKQIWDNVKKMRKEFSKLNKKNKRKLNVSIEMVKKTQHLKSNHTPLNTQQVYNIDDNTPGNENSEKEVIRRITENVDTNQTTIQTFKEDPNLKDTDCNKILEKSPKALSVEYGAVESICKNRSNDNSCNKLQNIKNNVQNDKQLNENTTINGAESNSTGFIFKPYNKEQSNKPTEIKNTRMPFIKRSALVPKNLKIACDNCDKHTKSASSNTCDVEITVKVGSTITNIIIKQKEKDVQVKVNTDREAQTFPEDYGLCNDQPGKKCNNRNDVETNLNNNDTKISEPTNNKLIKNVQLNPNDNKSVSTKKNTASADTATAHFEITESIEKELSKIMECEKTPDTPMEISNDIKTQIGKTAKNKDKKNQSQNELECVNDLDIFGSGSIKETDIHILKEPAPSEILVSTACKKIKTQKISEKRSRDDTDDNPTNKKMKVTQEECLKDSVPDSEPINYDAVMVQVFANIDADIDDIRKSQQDKKINNSEDTGNKCTIMYPVKDNCIVAQKTQIIKNESYIANVEAASDLNDYLDQKHSENVFSVMERDENSEIIKNDKIPQQDEELLTPVLCRDLNASQESQGDLNLTNQSLRKTVQDNYDSDKSVLEETPQKIVPYSNVKRVSILNKEENHTNLAETRKISLINVTDKSVVNLTDTLMKCKKISGDDSTIDTISNKQSLETPLTIKKFADQIQYNSTPVTRKPLNTDNIDVDHCDVNSENTLCLSSVVAKSSHSVPRKSLNFDNDLDDDPDDVDSGKTLCTSSGVAKTTQEKEFLRKAFEKTPTSMIKSLTRRLDLRTNKKLCLAGSCLLPGDIAKIKCLCNERNWTYVEKYTKDVTHLVVGVDEEKKAQRSVKYMCALAASKWIVSFEWIKKCLIQKDLVDEEPFEALDSTGEPGPKRSRIATQKIFRGIKFYCMPPFSVLEADTLKSMLVAAGGEVADELKDVRVAPNSGGPALLLAEPEHTQEDRFTYLTMESSVVPVNYEWVLNCLGSYTLDSVLELLLCPSSLLPAATSSWPRVLLAPEYE